MPHGYRRCFPLGKKSPVLSTHLGYDPGILPVFKKAVRVTGCRKAYSTVTRLLIDQNRTPGNPSLYSAYSCGLDEVKKQKLLDRYYTPYVSRLERHIREGLEYGPVIHVSFHSFTPVFEGRTRPFDMGILFDPRSSLERMLADELRGVCEGETPLTIRFNEPYLGTDDGMCSMFRNTFGGGYAGIELEFRNTGLSPAVTGDFARLTDCVIRWLNRITGGEFSDKIRGSGWRITE